MPIVPYHRAADVADTFLDLLERRGIAPPAATAAEPEFLSLAALLDIWRDPSRIRNAPNEAPIMRRAAAIHDLADKVSVVEGLREFSALEDSLKTIAQAKDFTAIGRMGDVGAGDDISGKMAELYVGCLAAACARDVVLDHSNRATGDSPEILLTWEKRRWALAVRTLGPARGGQTIFETIEKAAAQIAASAADCGLIVTNAGSVIDHDALWNPAQPFGDEEAAAEALRVQLRELIALAAKDRPQAQWDALFAGKTVPPVIFIAQSVVRLPLGGGLEAPTPVNVMVTDACNRPPDIDGTDLAEELEFWMEPTLHIDDEDDDPP